MEGRAILSGLRQGYIKEPASNFTDPQGRSAVERNKEQTIDMERDYGSFQCRVCGSLVLVPLSSRGEDEGAVGDDRELTCAHGHTDSYDLSDLQSSHPKTREPLKVRRAIAGIG